MKKQAAAVIEYIEGLKITQGAGIGRGFDVLPWERRFLRGALRPGVSEAALSVARGNGKTTLIAAIAAAAIDGPLVQPRGEVAIVASSFDQARICFEHILAFLGEKTKDRSSWRVLDYANRASIENRLTGARVRALASDPRRAHGLAPSLVIADEPAQWPDSTSDRMRAALDTSLGKIEGSRLISIGTRPGDAQHWFEVALKGGADYAQAHVANRDDPPFRARTWIKANPSLPFMPTLKARIKREAETARRNPQRLPAFQALRLNLGVEDVERAALLDASTWARIEGSADVSGPCVWGVDLGTTAAMSAIAAYWPDTGRLDALAAFPDIPALDERGQRDGVSRLYIDMARRGELITTPGRVVNVEMLLREALSRWGPPAAVGSDRWRQGELLDALNLAGVPVAAFVPRGQGFKDGAEDVRAFRAAALSGRLTPLESLLLRSAMGEAVVVADAAGNEKLAKASAGGRRQRGRDDAAAASIIAVSVGSRRAESSTADPEVEIAVV